MNQRIGEGDVPLVMVHGSGSGAAQMVRLAEQLVARNQRLAVWIPELAGYGSPIDETRNPIAANLEILEQVIKEIAAPAFLLGHSMGGFLAIKLAAGTRASIRGIVAIEPVAFGVLDPVSDAAARDEDARVIERMMTRLEGNDLEAGLAVFIEYWNQTPWAELPAGIKKHLLTLAPQITQEALAVSTDRTTLEDYAAAGPLHLMCGDASPRPVQAVVTRLSQLEQASLRWLPGLKHMSLLSNPGAYLTDILEFIERQGR